ncbi:TIGR03087 family PEP-CTERM/XrtA system glycosyltransferase [Glaciimonas sp. CA11.2]|uniref:TIGR03087 family PEP-CTERM/XrtA system glycosyltransferase n=1 Tax=Glaciimonas sp. CA11.2 TaxID=3048601 RepID=UPI002AB59009|nr:TIGR03087 family PEP-CTERM/XrtA system glycosyltransferase [Glaciimonas sp. CA11.2]MDY7544686.1 TIGR03087 family PEP-CTERM/XrtA system glycosyltransferase [Glaciimonas sp. CA11.2]MEB0164167.1 TIGR03087 family PEP-CTERM/XrtA system glycosyltransferase [Glaciimonas sp. CA11.2]
MEHLLFLVHRIPYPPNKGDKIRSYHLLKHLAQRYHVHLGTFVDDPDDWQYVDKVKQLCDDTHFAALNSRIARLRSLGALGGNRALSLDYYRDPGLHAWVKRVLANNPISRVLVFSSAMAQYAGSAQLTRRVIDFVDVDSDKWRQYSEKKSWFMRWLYRREARQLLSYEQQVSRNFDTSLFVSAPEADLFRQLAPDSAHKIGFFNNGVDTDYFSPEHLFPNPYQPNQLVMVFTGAMDYWPNIDAVRWFAYHILPAIRVENPTALFYIVGARPSPQVQELANFPGIQVTGSVPDVRPYLAHAHLAVAPLRIARGIQNKVLEAMAMAKPVLVSSQAFEGIDAMPNRELMLAESAEQFVTMATDLLQRCNVEHDNLGARAREKVKATYGWANKLSIVDGLLDINMPPTFI